MTATPLEWLHWIIMASRLSPDFVACFHTGYVYDPRDMIVCETCRREHDNMVRCLVGVVQITNASRLSKETEIHVNVPSRKLRDICPDCTRLIAENISKQLRQMAANETPIIQQYTVPPTPTRWGLLLMGAMAGAVVSTGITHAMPFILHWVHLRLGH